MQQTTEKEKQALQNALTSFKINLDLHVKLFNDKRKAKKFFLQDGPKSVSPVLDYNQMNHFILGISEGMKINEKAKTPSMIKDEILDLCYTLEDKLNYDETPQGTQIGQIINQLQSITL